jgi:hypothetical protein
MISVKANLSISFNDTRKHRATTGFAYIEAGFTFDRYLRCVLARGD